MMEGKGRGLEQRAGPEVHENPCWSAPELRNVGRGFWGGLSYT